MSRIDMRFFIEANSMPLPFSGCWIWMRSVNRKGYGLLRRDGQTLAHRASFATFNGQIPRGLFVLHRCDTPCCVNPDHLFAGTALQNTRDMFKKGRNRNARGEHAGLAKLTRAMVTEMRSMAASGLSHRALARHFGVSKSTATSAINCKTWI